MSTEKASKSNKRGKAQVEENIVFSLHLPMSGYRKLKEAAKKCDLTMQAFARQALASAIFKVP